MNNKVCLVTGATSGIGAETALGLARAGARVVLVGRDPGRCRLATDRIAADSGNREVTAHVADLSSQAAIRGLAAELLGRYERIDVLVNNAGAMFLDRRLSVDGIEMTMALNHFGYFLLTNLLLDRIKASAPARVVNVSSAAHQMGRFRFEDVPVPSRYSGFRAYAQSKLANVLFTRELARRMEGTGVTVNALHPGFVASNFLADKGRVGWVLERLAPLIAISSARGAETPIYLATSPEVEGVTGRYFYRKREAASSAESRDEGVARRLWDLSEAMTGLASAAA